MWTKLTFFIFILQTALSVIDSNVLPEDKPLKRNEMLPHKTDDEENSVKSLTETEDRISNLHHPVLQSEPQQYLMPMDIGTIMLNQLPQQEYYLLYYFPADGVFNEQQFLPTNVHNEVNHFSNTHENPYENNNQILRDNVLEYIFVQGAQLAPDATMYNDNMYQNNYLSIDPISYVTPYKILPETSSFLTRPYLEDTASPTPSNYYNNSEVNNYENIPFHLNRRPHIYLQPPAAPVYGAHLTNPSSENAHKDTKQQSPNVEITKALGYELPVVPTQQPIVVTRSYFFDGESTTTLNSYEPMKTERDKNMLHKEWIRNSEEKHETVVNTFSNNPIIVDEDMTEDSYNKTFNQYIFSNRRPITFEDYLDEDLQMTEHTNGINNKDNLPSTHVTAIIDISDSNATETTTKVSS